MNDNGNHRLFLVWLISTAVWSLISVSLGFRYLVLPNLNQTPLEDGALHYFYAELLASLIFWIGPPSIAFWLIKATAPNSN